MSELAEDLQAKANLWKAEAERASEEWRDAYEMLAREYERVAKERMCAVVRRLAR